MLLAFDYRAMASGGAIRTGGGRLLGAFLLQNCRQTPVKRGGFLATNRQMKLLVFGAASFSSSSSSSSASNVRILSGSYPPPHPPPHPPPLPFLRPQRFSYSSSSSSSGSQIRNTATDSSCQEIVAQRLDGLSVLSVPMPSRPENCRFVLKPLANTLCDFVSFLKAEDAAIGTVEARTEGGELIPGLTTVDALLKTNFYLQINDRRFLVRTPLQEDFVYGEKTEDLSEVKDTVARLFRSLYSDQFHAVQQRHLLARLEQVKVELEPLEKIREELHRRATRRTRALSWVGLGLMGLQLGFLARLTWWEYSWDIMEPVTYFVTYGTAMAMFAYHLLTIQDYAYPDAHDREVVMTLHRLAGKLSFDVPKYNRLRSEKARLEFDLERLRNPLENKINPPFLPPPQTPSRPTTDAIEKA